MLFKLPVPLMALRLSKRSVGLSLASKPACRAICIDRWSLSYAAFVTCQEQLKEGGGVPKAISGDIIPL
jgi:hypothetical protein